MSAIANTVTVTFVDVATRKSRNESVPRTATVADLYQLFAAKRPLTLTVADGCTPSGSTVVGDLYDVCGTAKTASLTLLLSMEESMGACCMPSQEKIMDDYLNSYFK